MLGVDGSSVGALAPGFPALERGPCSPLPTPRAPTQKPDSFSEPEVETSRVAGGRPLNLSELWFPQLPNGGTVHPAPAAQGHTEKGPREKPSPPRIWGLAYGRSSLATRHGCGEMARGAREGALTDGPIPRAPGASSNCVLGWQWPMAVKPACVLESWVQVLAPPFPLCITLG